MTLKVGIVGLPNVGKSTLFNALTNSQVEAANYPFATIEPNVGTVAVFDPRLEHLETLFQARKKIATTIEFVDIAGLIAGAANGEGLGNAFLNNIRETDALIQVVRCFDDKEITHVEGSVDPIRDLEIINLELLLADEQLIQKRFVHLTTKFKSGDKTHQTEIALLEKLKKQLATNGLLNQLTYTPEEEKILSNWRLLTLKPFIYVANVTDLVNDNQHLKALQTYALAQGFKVVTINAQLESEVSELTQSEKLVFLTEMGFSQTGLEKLIQTSYQILDMKTFFTAGPKEVHSWAFKDGMTAPECAGLIHSDFQRGFIKAEIYNYQSLLQFKNERSVKDHGQVRLEGKNYLMMDGDICFFKFNV